MKNELLLGLAVFHVLFVILALSAKLAWPGLKARVQLRLQWSLLFLTGLMILVLPLFPEKVIFAAPLRFESLIHSRSVSVPLASHAALKPAPTETAALAFRDIDFSLAIVLGLITLLWLVYFLTQNFRQMWRLRQEISHSFELRKVGGLSIVLSARTEIPFAIGFWRQVTVVMPQALICEHRHFRIALAHELQHARNGDLRINWILFPLQAIAGWNPFVRDWLKNCAELQELAVDEALIENNKVNIIDYGRCLVEVAQRALHHHGRPVGATSLIGWGGPHQLKRRMNRMFNPKSSKKKWVSMVSGMTLTAFTALALSGAAYAARSVGQDRRLSTVEAQDWLRRMTVTPGFKVTLNKEVMAELNVFLGKAEARKFMRKAMQRMQGYRGMVEGEIQSFGAPMELAAMPLVESGYQNIEQNPKVGVSAGIWQFIPSTARNYGLRVDAQVDERLNERKLTQTAMRYLLSNYHRFQDWELAILAFNIGENRVQQGIDRLQTRDAWVLVRNGFENDSRYLAKVMAAVLIMNNPEALE